MPQSGARLKTVGILLAAGRSRRFGESDKLLALWHGEPLVRAAARTLAAAGCDALAAIVSSEAVGDVLPEDYALCRVPPGQPLSASFRRACDWALEVGAERLLIALGDMPAIAPDTLRRLVARSESGACIHRGIRMPPALLRVEDLRGFALEEGDRGARGLLAALPEEALLPLAEHEARDVDYPQDLHPGG